MNSVITKEFVTKTEVVKGSFEWKLENFFFLINKENGESICSPSFTVDNNTTKWHIEVYPNGCKNIDTKNCVSVFFTPESKDTNHLIQYKFSIINKNRIKENILSGSHHFKNTSIGHGFVNFITIELLKNNKETLLPGNSLTICLDFEVGVNSRSFEVNTDCQAKYFNGKCEEQIKLSEDFGNLLEKLELTDIVLVTSTEELKAHKAILGARSPVFLAMFTNNMTETLQSKIKIVDFDTEVICEMLKFIYTGKINNIEKNADNLLLIADKYEILGLKNLCENFLFSKISIENASDLLSIADQCGSEDFKTKVIKFIISHKKEIISTSKFIDLKAKNPILIADLFCIDC